MSHQFFAACHKPFAEAFVAAYLFQYHRAADIFAQTRFDKVGKNAKAIQEYVANQLKTDKEADQLSIFDPRDPLTGSK